MSRFYVTRMLRTSGTSCTVTEIWSVCGWACCTYNCVVIPLHELTPTCHRGQYEQAMSIEEKRVAKMKICVHPSVEDSTCLLCGRDRPVASPKKPALEKSILKAACMHACERVQ